MVLMVGMPVGASTPVVVPLRRDGTKPSSPEGVWKCGDVEVWRPVDDGHLWVEPSKGQRAAERTLN